MYIILIFDIEIIILIPFCLSIYQLNFEDLVIGVIFIISLIIGVIYEIKSKVLNF